MNQFRLTYKQFFAILVLSAYLIGNFSMPIFEGIHFLLHLGDEIHFHSFQSHNTQHQHKLLINLDDLSKASNSSDQPIDTQKVKKSKKNLQFLPTIIANDFTGIVLNRSIAIIYISFYRPPVLKLDLPPPQKCFLQI